MVIFILVLMVCVVVGILWLRLLCNGGSPLYCFVIIFFVGGVWFSFVLLLLITLHNYYSCDDMIGRIIDWINVVVNY